MIARVRTPYGERTLLVFCRACDARAVQVLKDADIFAGYATDKPPPGTETGSRFCVHCSFCGVELYLPPYCLLHGVGCPVGRPEATVQALGVMAMLRRLFARLTDAGWEHLAEEIRLGGTGGVPMLDAVAENLIRDPHLVEDGL